MPSAGTPSSVTGPAMLSRAWLARSSSLSPRSIRPGTSVSLATSLSVALACTVTSSALSRRRSGKPIRATTSAWPVALSGVTPEPSSKVSGSLSISARMSSTAPRPRSASWAWMSSWRISGRVKRLPLTSISPPGPGALRPASTKTSSRPCIICPVPLAPTSSGRPGTNCTRPPSKAKSTPVRMPVSSCRRKALSCVTSPPRMFSASQRRTLVLVSCGQRPSARS